MSTVTPPSPPPPATATVALVRAAVLQATQAVSELPPGSKIDVVIADIVSANEIKLASLLGDITVKLPGLATVKVGDALILQILSGGAQPRVQLAGADGRPLTLSPLLPQAKPGDTTTPLAVPNSDRLQLAPGGIVTATLLRPISFTDGQLVLPLAGQGTAGAPAGQPATTAPGLLAGQPNPLQPGTPGQPNPAGAQPGAALSGQPGVPGQTGPVGAAQSAAIPGGTVNFPSGSGLSVKIISINIATTVPASLTPPPPQGQISLAPGSVISGVVSGHQGVGQTVLSTHIGPLSLPTTTPLPPGSELKFEILTFKPPAPGTAQHGQLHAEGAPLAEGDWQAFDEALDVLREAAPGAHNHIMQSAMPKADQQLASNVLFFLSALRGGELRKWIGDGPSRILEQLRPELAGRLKSDLGQMSRKFEDPLSGEWRLNTVPFLHGAEIDRLQLLIRDQDNKDDDQNPGKGGTRFVVDLNLTRIGHMQIDGLVGNDNKRLDLVLRTDDPLAPVMRDDIRRLYADAMELTGLEGSVGFQAAPGGFVEIPKGPSAARVAGGGMVI